MRVRGGLRKQLAGIHAALNVAHFVLSRRRASGDDDPVNAENERFKHASDLHDLSVFNLFTHLCMFVRFLTVDLTGRRQNTWQRRRLHGNDGAPARRRTGVGIRCSLISLAFFFPPPQGVGMANKGPTFGLSRQVQEKIDSKYDPELEQILVEWINRQCGAGVGKPEPGKLGFQAWLKDGCVSDS